MKDMIKDHAETLDDLHNQIQSEKEKCEIKNQEINDLKDQIKKNDADHHEEMERTNKKWGSKVSDLKIEYSSLEGQYQKLKHFEKKEEFLVTKLKEYEEKIETMEK